MAFDLMALIKSIQNPMAVAGGGDYSEYLINPDAARSDPSAGQAALTRAQYDMYLKRGVPIEDALIKYATDSAEPEKAAEEAGRYMSGAFEGVADQTARRMSRYGVQQTAEQKRVNDRLTGLDRATSITGAKNAARLKTYDDQVQTLSDLLSIGNNISTSATRNLDSASSMQSARDRANDAAKARDKQAIYGTLGTLGGLAISAWL